MFQIEVTLLTGTELRPVSFNKRQQNEEAFFRNIHGARMFPQCFSVSHTGNNVVPCQFLFSRCKLCLRYAAGNFNEIPSMRALAIILQVRASEQ